MKGCCCNVAAPCRRLLHWRVSGLRVGGSGLWLPGPVMCSSPRAVYAGAVTLLLATAVRMAGVSVVHSEPHLEVAVCMGCQTCTAVPGCGEQSSTAGRAPGCW